MVKLVDLDPRWLVWEGKRIGMIFKCPHCYTNPDASKRAWITVFDRKGIPTFGDEWDDANDCKAGFGQLLMARAALGRTDPYDTTDIITCKPEATWTPVPPFEEATFDNISITPSLDSSLAGHWHGYVTNGECVS